MAGEHRRDPDLLERATLEAAERELEAPPEEWSGDDEPIPAPADVYKSGHANVYHMRRRRLQSR